MLELDGALGLSNAAGDEGLDLLDWITRVEDMSAGSRDEEDAISISPRWRPSDEAGSEGTSYSKPFRDGGQRGECKQLHSQYSGRIARSNLFMETQIRRLIDVQEFKLPTFLQVGRNL